MKNSVLIGPFKQILSMDSLPDSGMLRDDNLEIFKNAAVLIENGNVKKVLYEKEFQENIQRTSHYSNIKVI